MTPDIVQLSDPAATDPQRFGPKAANQALLAAAGLPIPAGFCLGADAYCSQLAALGLEQAAQRAVCLQGQAARPFISKVRIGLFEGPITAAIREPLLKAWRDMVDASGALTVVRSSSLLEDTDGLLFAGQFESFLGLETEHDFLTAVKACWAALWSSRALKYMLAHELSPADSAMALCIQPLVDARSAGGGMSRTADDNMLLSATRGLGTAVAQGEVVPDRYLLNRAGELLEVTAGRTQHNVHCAHHGNRQAAEKRTLNPHPEPCLGNAQAIELGQLMLCAERVLQRPVEIEWALDEAGFKMLQARPLHMEKAPEVDEIWSRRPALKGQPSGVGWAEGRSCVINCECELSRVAPGDVLVTKVAGPALSQVLPRVAGVVAELGGSTSHLASLARERSIPMVLGVLEATRKIPDGVQTGVDGVMGMVRWQY